ncbi:hypothetical protein BpHYR1_006850 [Brachionus plicatilis]|uniref:Uncharacterized protein n=1 Tax=Brachionus plicatilis TaxID=10195 RepID=A0A3M7P991_BRAPC|nr:hypothetical protein BpHYR1_006850 [Brachionus plicatilis]
MVESDAPHILESEELEKDLGVTFDRNLDFSSHIRIQANKDNLGSKIHEKEFNMRKMSRIFFKKESTKRSDSLIELMSKTANGLCDQEMNVEVNQHAPAHSS